MKNLNWFEGVVVEFASGNVQKLREQADISKEPVLVPEDPGLMNQVMRMKWMEQEWDESSFYQLYSEDNETVLRAQV